VEAPVPSAQPPAAERVVRRLSRLAALHSQLGAVYRELAEDARTAGVGFGAIQLATGADPRLMAESLAMGALGNATCDSTATARVAGRSATFPVPAPAAGALQTVDDLARLMQVGPKTIRRWRSEGRLPAGIVLGGVVRWHADDVRRWIDEQREGAR
jgi:excisionase family DNA binding protein